MKKINLLSFTFTLIFTSLGSAQVLTESQALELAIDHSITAKLARTKLDRALAQEKIIGAQIFPTFIFDGSSLLFFEGSMEKGFDTAHPGNHVYMTVEQSLPGGGNLQLSLEHTLGLALEDPAQLLFRAHPRGALTIKHPLGITQNPPGYFWNRTVEEGSLYSEKAQAQFHKEMKDLKIEVQSLYYEVRRLRRDEEYARRYEDYQRNKLNNLQQISNSGRASQAQVWKVQREFENAIEEHFLVSGNLTRAETQLAGLMGLVQFPKDLDSGTPGKIPFPKKPLDEGLRVMVLEKTILENSWAKAMEANAPRGVFNVSVQPVYKTDTPGYRTWYQAWNFSGPDTTWNVNLSMGLTYGTSLSDRCSWEKENHESLVLENDLQTELWIKNREKDYQISKQKWEAMDSQCQFYQAEEERLHRRVAEGQLLVQAGLITSLDLEEIAMDELRVKNKYLELMESRYLLAAGLQ